MAVGYETVNKELLHNSPCEYRDYGGKRILVKKSLPKRVVACVKRNFVGGKYIKVTASEKQKAFGESKSAKVVTEIEIGKGKPVGAVLLGTFLAAALIVGAHHIADNANTNDGPIDTPPSYTDTTPDDTTTPTVTDKKEDDTQDDTSGGGFVVKDPTETDDNTQDDDDGFKVEDDKTTTPTTPTETTPTTPAETTPTTTPTETTTETTPDSDKNQGGFQIPGFVPDDTPTP